MRGYRVPVREVSETGRQRPAILQANATCPVNFGDSHDFTVCGPESVLTSVCREQQPVASGDFDGTSFVYVERLRLFRCEGAFLTDGIANRHALVGNPNHLQRLVLLNAFDCAIEPQHLSGGEIPGIALLCRGPVEGYVASQLGNRRYWEERTFTSEIRPIVGLHLKPWDIIFNPILDNEYYGGVRNLQFNPATRVAYNFNDRWTVAAEEYDGFGSLRNFVPVSQQFHEVWAVMDHNNKMVNIEAGVGVGYTAGGDRLTFKLMLSRDLNKKHEPQTPEAKPPQ